MIPMNGVGKWAAGVELLLLLSLPVRCLCRCVTRAARVTTTMAASAAGCSFADSGGDGGGSADWAIGRQRRWHK